MAKLTTQTTNIIASGSVFTFKSEPLRFEIESRLVIELHFVDEKDKGRSIEGGPAKDQNGKEYLRLSVYNPEGMGGTTSPLTISQDDTTHKKTYLNLAFHRHSDSILCHYTIFEEK